MHQAVSPRQPIHIRIISAANEAGNRDACTEACVDHLPEITDRHGQNASSAHHHFASVETVIGQREPSQDITLVWIDACIIEHQIWSKGPKHMRQCLGNHTTINGDLEERPS